MAAEELNLDEYAQVGDEALRGIHWLAQQALVSGAPVASMDRYEAHVQELRTIDTLVMPEAQGNNTDMSLEPNGQPGAGTGLGQTLLKFVGAVLG